MNDNKMNQNLIVIGSIMLIVAVALSMLFAAALGVDFVNRSCNIEIIEHNMQPIILNRTAIMHATTTSSTLHITTTVPISTTTTLSDIQIVIGSLNAEDLEEIITEYKNEHKKAASTPNLPLKGDMTNNEGRWFINRSVTFNRKGIAGVMYQIFEVDEEQLNYTLDPEYMHEKVVNVMILYWNGTLVDKSEMFLK